MSSFVIDKQEFIKVAGFCAGLADNRNRFGEPVIYLWDYSRSRVYKPEDYYPAFVWLYQLNALSVKMQYRDDEMENDPKEYKSLFTEYRRKAKALYMRAEMDCDAKQKLVDSIYRFHEFLNCLLYQVEDPECEAKVKGFCFRLEHKLFGIMEQMTGHFYDGGWPDFEL